MLVRGYRIRNESIIESDLPRWLLNYSDGLRGTTPKSARFREWICQFQSSEILLATKLFARLRLVDHVAIRVLWRNVFNRVLPHLENEQEFSIFGLGHGAKSGRSHLYSFRQAISGLPEYERFSGGAKQIFRDIAEIDCEYPNVVLFLDDFIGTGEQATRLLRNNFAQYEWLRESKVIFCSLLGFRQAMEQLPLNHEVRLADVIVAEVLEESDRAFSFANKLWPSSEEAAKAEEWARRLGCALLSSAQYDVEPARDALGWRGSQALMAFHYNIPNNTLPIFWARGKRDGKDWIPLLDRFD